MYRLNKEIMDKELARQMMEAERRSRRADQPFAPEEPPYAAASHPHPTLLRMIMCTELCRDWRV